MTDCVKHLPTAAIPEGPVAVWGVESTGRWLRAGVPAVFSPVAGSRLLVGPVVASILLTVRQGEEGRTFATTVLLAALPFWFRYLPVPALLAALALAAEAARTLSGAPGTAGTAGHGLVIAHAAWASTGVLLRLHARRRQREPALAAAGSARFPLPATLPAGHLRRGLPGILLGSVCCLAAAPALIRPYGPFDGRLLDAALLAAGTTLLGRGLASGRAARRLRARPQPALLVGVRAAASGHNWVYPDAVSTAGPPLISHFPRVRHTVTGQRVLLGGSERTLRTTHHDVDPGREPFQAVLYGPVYEGAEVVLESAAYEQGVRLVPRVTAAPLLPRRRHGLSEWKPAGGSYREAVREQARRDEERRRERARERRSRAAPAPPPGAAAEGDAAAGAAAAGAADRPTGAPGPAVGTLRERARPVPPARPPRSGGSVPRRAPRRPHVPPRPPGRAG
ncbi:hypothetical protein [Streptomyces avidinii]|uniref:Integral membrane protein n=1 Tax=Streptomyces avidinii TaxID=1895 RepID=A0ABS4KZC4_STRAV|nr:hypothetical protein [Streptomyces avidinii]MBP2035000.1 hypothetical protein [Streptomyces avidinii]GGY90396.1 hypothetical protein GCM10010343_14850 [Streptomyces avidinii]